MDASRVEVDEVPPIPINLLIQQKNFLIWVLKGLSAALMPPKLPVFKDIRDEGLLALIEHFIEILTTCLIINSCYYLVWFSTTLKKKAYEWYCNNSSNTFLSWDIIQCIFLEQFWHEVEQSMVLTTLSSFR